MTSPTALTVRTPDDLLACVPLVLGFLPEDSAVVISLPPGAGPHARADVDDTTDLVELGRSLVAPVRSHGVARVAVVVYADLHRAPVVARHLEETFTQQGVEVVAALAADGARWLSVTPATSEPRDYDPLAHPFVAEAVVRGQVVLASRHAVRAQLDLDERLAAEVDACRGGEVGVQDPAWIRRTMERHRSAGTLPDAGEVARLLLAVGRQDGRDAAWAWVDRSHARDHVEFWLRVVRGCRPRERAASAAVLAFHAWLAGDGALAWCGVEASAAAADPCSLAALVEDLLVKAAPPSMWAPLVDPAVGSGAGGGDAPCDESVA